MTRRPDFHGYGSALRLAFSQGLRGLVHSVDVTGKGWEPPPVPELDDALNKVNEASAQLSVVARLAVNPFDQQANEDGIALALRRLSEDVRT